MPPSSTSIATLGPNAVATLLCAETTLLLHDLQPLDPGAVAVGLRPPFLLASSNSRTQLVSRTCLTCFAVWPGLRLELGFGGDGSGLRVEMTSLGLARLL